MIETLFNDTSATKRKPLDPVCIDRSRGLLSEDLTTDTEIDDHSFHSIALYAFDGLFRLAYYGDKTPNYMTLPSAFTSAHVLRTAGSFLSITGASCSGTNDLMTDGDLMLHRRQFVSPHHRQGYSHNEQLFYTLVTGCSIMEEKARTDDQRLRESTPDSRREFFDTK